MYMSTNEHLGRMQIDHVSAAFSLAQQTFQVFEEFVELNQQVLRQALVESEQSWQVAMSGKTPLELWLHQANAMRPTAEKVLSYNHQLVGIATRAQAQFLKFIEARFQYCNSELQTAVDGVAQNAPAGAEAAVTVLKTTLSNAGVAYDTVLKAAAQAIAMAQQHQPAGAALQSGAAKSRDDARAD